MYRELRMMVEDCVYNGNPLPLDFVELRIRHNYIAMSITDSEFSHLMDIIKVGKSLYF